MRSDLLAILPTTAPCLGWEMKTWVYIWPFNNFLCHCMFFIVFLNKKATLRLVFKCKVHHKQNVFFSSLISLLLLVVVVVIFIPLFKKHTFLQCNAGKWSILGSTAFHLFVSVSAVRSRRLPHWTGPATLHHYGGKATHQQRPGVYSPVRFLFFFFLIFPFSDLI